jgi:hypothetical protein
VTGTLRIRGSHFRGLLSTSRDALQRAVETDMTALLKTRVAVTALRVGSLIVDFGVDSDATTGAPAHVDVLKKTGANPSAAWLVETRRLYSNVAQGETLSVQSVDARAAASPSGDGNTADGGTGCGPACVGGIAAACVVVIGAAVAVMMLRRKQRAAAAVSQMEEGLLGMTMDDMDDGAALSLMAQSVAEGAAPAAPLTVVDLRDL